MYDDATDPCNQLALYWRHRPGICDFDVYAVQLLDSLRADLVCSPLTVLDGLALTRIRGLATYVSLNGLFYVTKKLSGGKIVTEDEDLKEYWTYKIAGPLPWFIRAAKNPKQVFAPTIDDRLPRRSIHSSIEDKTETHEMTTQTGFTEAHPSLCR
jgi:hypothetical protein